MDYPEWQLVPELMDDEDIVIGGVDRTTLRLYNNNGFDFEEIDVIALVGWLRKNRPEFLECKNEQAKFN